MDKGNTNDIQGQIPQVVRSLDELARKGAQHMIAEALVEQGIFVWDGNYYVLAVTD